MNYLYKLLFLAIAFVCLTACDPKSNPSEEFKTKEIHAVMEFESGENDYARIRVALKQGNALAESVKLSGDETLVASFNGQSVRLEEDIDVFDIDYEGSLYSAKQAGEFAISFNRSGGEVVNSNVQMPQPFEITSPEHWFEYYENESLSVLWEGSLNADKIHFLASLKCYITQLNGDSGHTFVHESVEVDNDGSFSLQIQVLAAKMRDHMSSETNGELDFSQPCELSTSLTRASKEDIGNLYASTSFIRAQQKRSVLEMKVTLFED